MSSSSSSHDTCGSSETAAIAASVTADDAASNEGDVAETPDMIEELIINNTKVRKGLVKVSNGKSCPVSTQLYLTVDMLHLQRQELCEEDPRVDGGNQNDVPDEKKIRMVKIIREEDTGLGLSIKGGSEHNLPIMISHIIKGQAADKTGKLFVGDAIIKVNGEMIVHCTHDEAVNILRNAGDLIMLTVKHYKAATPFLRKEECKDESKNENSPQKSTINDVTFHRRWVNIVTIPLTMAYVSRYVHGTDKLRPNGFEVYSAKGVRSGIIYCDSPAILSEWLKYISDNISSLTQLEIRMYNRFCSAADRIEYMGWVNEGVPVKLQKWHTYEMRFFAVKGSDMYFFQTPPSKAEDWSACEITYKLYTSSLRVVKETQTVDERQHCLLFNTAGQQTRYFSVETRQELLKIESAWNSASSAAVRRLGCMRFGVIIGRPIKSAELIIDWNNGYALYDSHTNEYIWRYRYSQLRGSSDDGKSKLKLHFRDDETKGIQTKEVESPNLDAILYCMLAFMHAKVAAVDPNCPKGL